MARDADEAAHSMSALFHSQGFAAGFLCGVIDVHVPSKATVSKGMLKLHSHTQTVGCISFFVSQWRVALIGQIDPKCGVDTFVIGVAKAGR